MTAYSSYETLALFQSVAKHGPEASTFQEISNALIRNESNPQNGIQDVERLSAKALRGLYDELVDKEKTGTTLKVNGDVHSGERSPKRRKLSPSPEPNNGFDQNDQQLVQELVDKLYNRYKEQIIVEIRKEEEDYARLQEEIDSLTSKIETLKGEAAESSVAAVQDGARPQANNHSVKGSSNASGKADVLISTARVTPASTEAKPSDEVSNQKSLAASSEGDSSNAVPQDARKGHSSATASNQNPTLQIPAQNLQTPNHASSSASSRSPASQSRENAPHAFPPSKRQEQPSKTISPSPGVQSRPSVRNHVPHPQGSPVPSQPHPYPPYAQYPHQWHPHMPPTQYTQHMGYGPPPYYPQPVPGHHPQTPQQPHYQPYPHTAPMPYGPSHGWHAQPYGQYSASSVTTPISRPASQVSVIRSGSTTPWRKKRDSGILRPSSPRRPERAISPLEPDASPPPSISVPKSEKDNITQTVRAEELTPIQGIRTSRRGRPPSKTPSAMAPSRSQSIASHKSDAANEKSGFLRRGEKSEPEPPSTPLPPPSDSETPRSSGRRGRPRHSTLPSQDGPNRAVTAKRKRESISPSRSIQSTTTAPTTIRAGDSHTSSMVHDPSLVLVSKNFSKTSQLLLNEITSHKLAGIFAKPLSERDAPGYKDLVHRTQDLKSIKAAISKGSRAALPAIEAVEVDNDETEGISVNAVHSINSPRAIGNGFYLVTKTSDLVPPKGIVNGAQLEMELMRMFANAIMFNPLPSSERGFGRNLRLRKNGGDVDPHSSRIPDSQADDSDDERGSEESDSTVAGGTGWDEGGIIADTREMFDDVGAAVDKWRILEDERMGNSGPNIDASRVGSIATPSATGTHLDVATTRHASVSASSNIGDDEGDGESTPVPSSVAGTTRKRRRIAEH